MARKLIERSKLRLLGEESGVERADMLVQWSLRHKPGQRWTKDFPFGLRLGFVAAGSHPKVYLHWNQHKFNQFRQRLEFNPDNLVFSEYGICVHYKGGRTRVTLPGRAGTKEVLWDSARPFCKQQEDTAVYWMLGLIKLESDGPLYLDEAECQQELEEAAAVATIRVDTKQTRRPVQPVKTPATVLPEKQLSPKARAYLLQDAITNLILKAQGQGRAA